MKYETFGFPVCPYTNKRLFVSLFQSSHIDEYVHYCDYFGCIYGAKIEGVFYVHPVNVYLDDERRPPRGWFIVDNVDDMNELVAKCRHVKTISLDHDLGIENDVGSGYDVLLFIEQAVFVGEIKKCPEILIHTANLSARSKMEAAVASIKKSLSNRSDNDN